MNNDDCIIDNFAGGGGTSEGIQNATGRPADAALNQQEYKIEYHRVWVKTVEAKSRKEAQTIIEEEMSEEPDAEDYSYTVVKRRDTDADGHKGSHAKT